MTTSPRRGRLSSLDVLRLAGYGLRARPLRGVLSALGIAIGIAAMVAVVGISTSSRAELNRLLDALGGNRANGCDSFPFPSLIHQIQGMNPG